MANAWFRMYHEFATDPKVQMLSECDQRRYVMLLCLRCCNGGETLLDDEAAFQLRVSNEEFAETKALLVSKGLIDESLNPTAWDKRQFTSDSSAARVARHRSRKKRAGNVTVTPPDTDTDTDTDKTPPPSSECSSGENLPSPGKQAEPIDLQVAEYILAGVRRLKPDLKLPNLETWTNDCRKMRELDGRTPRRIAEVFRWANLNDFWQSNILSPAKLRKQFDRLEIKMNQAPPPGGSGGGNAQLNDDDDSWFHELAGERIVSEDEGHQARLAGGVPEPGGVEYGETGVAIGDHRGGYPRLVGD